MPLKSTVCLKKRNYNAKEAQLAFESSMTHRVANKDIGSRRRCHRLYEIRKKISICLEHKHGIDKFCPREHDSLSMEARKIVHESSVVFLGSTFLLLLNYV
jgi:hypothetical protein